MYDDATAATAKVEPINHFVEINGLKLHYLDWGGDPGKHTLRIRYFGAHLSAPERVTYRYRLDGQDQSWQEVGARTEAVYTNLRPGPYTFHVAASNGNNLVLDHVQTDDRGSIAILKVAMNRLAQVALQLIEGIGFGKDGISEGSSLKATLRRFLN